MVKVKNMKEREAAREKRRQRKDELAEEKLAKFREEQKAEVEIQEKIREIFGSTFDAIRKEWPLDVVDDYGDVVETVVFTREQLALESDWDGETFDAPRLFVEHRFSSFPSSQTPWEPYEYQPENREGEYRFRLRDTTMPGANPRDGEPPRHYNCRSASIRGGPEEEEQAISPPMSLDEMRKRFSRE